MIFKRLIYGLQELGKEHNTLVGKKCVHLGELTKNGFPVPKGFALTKNKGSLSTGITRIPFCILPVK
jgi:phosphoenolpyruvate synthase/pyruvate phosphate dikinase